MVKRYEGQGQGGQANGRTFTSLTGWLRTVSTPDFAALFQRHRASMYLKAWSVLRGTGHESAADDIVMNALVSLMEHPPKNVENWEALLVRATGNKAVDLLRSASSRHAGGPVQDDRNDRTVSVEDDVIERVDSQREGAMLRDALAILDSRDRQIVWRFKGLGCPRAVVADQFGISPARVSQISTQALGALRDKLLEEGLQP